MENKNISQIALERIKGEGIKPISRNVFSIKRVLFWTAVGFSFIVGSFSFSLALHSLLNNDWDLYDRFGFNFVFKTLPYFWLLALLAFTILGEFYYRKTTFGHRHRYLFIIGIYFVSTTFFGTVFYLIGGAEPVEESLYNKAPVYRNIIFNHQVFWSNPEEGLLTGDVIFVGDSEMQIMDPNGYVWIVNKENASNRGGIIPEIGQKIKVIGDKIDKNLFKAEEIRPWLGVFKKGSTSFSH